MHETTYRMCVCMLSCFSHLLLFVTLWTVACPAPLSIGFSRQEYRSGSPSTPPGNLPSPGTEPTSLMSPALAGRFLTARAAWETAGVPTPPQAAPAAPTALSAPDHTQQRHVGRGHSHQRALWKRHAGSALLGEFPWFPALTVPSTWPGIDLINTYIC